MIQKRQGTLKKLDINAAFNCVGDAEYGHFEGTMGTDSDVTFSALENVNQLGRSTGYGS